MDKENKKEPKLSRKREKQTNKENKKESKVSHKHLQQALDAEFGVVRGIDFKNVFTVSKYIDLIIVRDSEALYHRYIPCCD
jgi:ATP-dependent RNA helicase DDX56/DBP9